MDGIITALVAALCIGIVTLIVAIIARFLGRFNEETRRIADNMRRAQDSDEYIYWQSRLRRHYIRLLPFVSEKTAGRICSRLFRKPKHCQEKEHSDGLFHILAPSVLSVCLCAICLCGMSWAWFTATGNTSVSTIKAASYTVKVEATPAESTTTNEEDTTEKKGATVTETEGGWMVTFNSAGEYTVTITPNGGTNAASQGYCEVVYSGATYYTGQLPTGSLTFKVNAAANDTLTVTPYWGTYQNSVKSENVVSGDTTLGSANASTSVQNNEEAKNKYVEADNEKLGSASNGKESNQNNLLSDSEREAGPQPASNGEVEESVEAESTDELDKKTPEDTDNETTVAGTDETKTTPGSSGSESSTDTIVNSTVETNDAENG